MNDQTTPAGQPEPCPNCGGRGVIDVLLGVYDGMADYLERPCEYCLPQEATRECIA